MAPRRARVEGPNRKEGSNVNAHGGIQEVQPQRDEMLPRRSARVRTRTQSAGQAADRRSGESTAGRHNAQREYPVKGKSAGGPQPKTARRGRKVEQQSQGGNTIETLSITTKEDDEERYDVGTSRVCALRASGKPVNGNAMNNGMAVDSVGLRFMSQQEDSQGQSQQSDSGVVVNSQSAVYVAHISPETPREPIEPLREPTENNRILYFEEQLNRPNGAREQENNSGQFDDYKPTALEHGTTRRMEPITEVRDSSGGSTETTAGLQNSNDTLEAVMEGFKMNQSRMDLSNTRPSINHRLMSRELGQTCPSAIQFARKMLPNNKLSTSLKAVVSTDAQFEDEEGNVHIEEELSNQRRIPGYKPEYATIIANENRNSRRTQANIDYMKNVVLGNGAPNKNKNNNNSNKTDNESSDYYYSKVPKHERVTSVDPNTYEYKMEQIEMVKKRFMEFYDGHQDNQEDPKDSDDLKDEPHKTVQEFDIDNPVNYKLRNFFENPYKVSGQHANSGTSDFSQRRRMHINATPRISITNVKSPGTPRKFTPDGKYLIMFSQNMHAIQVYSYGGPKIPRFLIPELFDNEPLLKFKDSSSIMKNNDSEIEQQLESLTGGDISSGDHGNTSSDVNDTLLDSSRFQAPIVTNFNQNSLTGLNSFANDNNTSGTNATGSNEGSSSARANKSGGGAFVRGETLFSEVFSLRYETNICSGGEWLCKDFCLFINDTELEPSLYEQYFKDKDTIIGNMNDSNSKGNLESKSHTGLSAKFIVLASAEPAEASADSTHTNGSVDNITIWSMDVRTGQIVSKYVMPNDFVYLTNQSGVHCYGNIICVTSVQYQKMNIFKVDVNTGKISLIKIIGNETYDDDNLLLESMRSKEIEYRQTLETKILDELSTKLSVILAKQIKVGQTLIKTISNERGSSTEMESSRQIGSIDGLADMAGSDIGSLLDGSVQGRHLSESRNPSSNVSEHGDISTNTGYLHIDGDDHFSSAEESDMDVGNSQTSMSNEDLSILSNSEDLLVTNEDALVQSSDDEGDVQMAVLPPYGSSEVVYGEDDQSDSDRDARVNAVRYLPKHRRSVSSRSKDSMTKDARTSKYQEDTENKNIKGDKLNLDEGENDRLNAFLKPRFNQGSSNESTEQTEESNDGKMTYNQVETIIKESSKRLESEAAKISKGEGSTSSQEFLNQSLKTSKSAARAFRNQRINDTLCNSNGLFKVASETGAPVDAEISSVFQDKIQLATPDVDSILEDIKSGSHQVTDHVKGTPDNEWYDDVLHYNRVYGKYAFRILLESRLTPLIKEQFEKESNGDIKTHVGKTITKADIDAAWISIVSNYLIARKAHMDELCECPTNNGNPLESNNKCVIKLPTKAKNIHEKKESQNNENDRMKRDISVLEMILESVTSNTHEHDVTNSTSLQSSNKPDVNIKKSRKRQLENESFETQLATKRARTESSNNTTPCETIVDFESLLKDTTLQVNNLIKSDLDIDFNSLFRYDDLTDSTMLQKSEFEEKDKLKMVQSLFRTYADEQYDTEEHRAMFIPLTLLRLTTIYLDAQSTALDVEEEKNGESTSHEKTSSQEQGNLEDWSLITSSNESLEIPESNETVELVNEGETLNKQTSISDDDETLKKSKNSDDKSYILVNRRTNRILKSGNLFIMSSQKMVCLSLHKLKDTIGAGDIASNRESLGHGDEHNRIAWIYNGIFGTPALLNKRPNDSQEASRVDNTLKDKTEKETKILNSFSADSIKGIELRETTLFHSRGWDMFPGLVGPTNSDLDPKKSDKEGLVQEVNMKLTAEKTIPPSWVHLKAEVKYQVDDREDNDNSNDSVPGPELYSKQRMSGFGHKIITYLYRRAIETDNDSTPSWSTEGLKMSARMALKQFYSDMSHLEQLSMWRAHFIDGDHLIIKLGNKSSVFGKSCEGANSNIIYFVIYCMSTSEVVGVFDNSSEELLKLYLNSPQLAGVRLVRTHTQNTLSVPSNSQFARDTIIKQLGNSIKSRSGGVTNAIRKALSHLPLNEQCIYDSPYLDVDLFSYDEKYISTTDRPRVSPSELMTKFFSRVDGSLGYSLFHPQAARRSVSSRQSRTPVYWIFHPTDPFVIGVQPADPMGDLIIHGI